MFERSMVESRKGRVAVAKLAFFPVSVALHTMIIAAAIFGAVWNVPFPRNTPAQTDSYSIAERLPLPPPAAPARRSVALPRPAAVPAQPGVEVAPRSIPSEIPSAIASPPTQVEGVEGGVDGDSDHGVVDGVPGGVPGGITTGPVPEDTLAPRPVGNGVNRPEIVSRFVPPYPPVAYAAHIQGFARVECVVDKLGQVRSVKIVMATFPPFGEAAADAVRRWRFKPGTLNGRPVDTIFVLQVDFRLTR